MLHETPNRLGVLLTLILTPAIYTSKLHASRMPYLVFHSQFIVADIVPLEQSRSKEGRSMQVVRACSQSRNYTDSNRTSFVKLLPHSQLHFAQVTALDSDSSASDLSGVARRGLERRSERVKQPFFDNSPSALSLHTRLLFSFLFNHIVCSMSRSKLFLLHFHILLVRCQGLWKSKLPCSRLHPHEIRVTSQRHRI